MSRDGRKARRGAETAPPGSEIDARAFETVRIKALGLVGKTGLRGGDLEDIQQELILHLISRKPKFDPSRARWSTFVRNVLDRQIATLIEGRKAAMRDYRKCCVPIEGPEDDDDADAIPARLDFNEKVNLQNAWRQHRSQVEEVDLAIDLDEALKAFPPKVRQACNAIKEVGIVEAARKAGMSRQKLSRYLRLVEERMAKVGIAVYFES